ncbi:hypothetical protein DPMN_021289 [Dreissena polymorpha]|uniref:Uncharacterized protein n=1 Tax=Dreissena polymorpha TaxID=45954 RepID=A0A9D4S912_DREPO|nr:hypothetical protein DPMN_021289 [Dreissena polymorpha]
MGTVGNAKVYVANFEIPQCKIYTETGTFSTHNLKRSQFICPETEACDPGARATS